MRLGGPIISEYQDPGEWIAALKERGYRAAYSPIGACADENLIREYRQAALDADIVIAEVGAWSNPLSSDETERGQALGKCKEQLALADTIGARCCVNIAGSRGSKWDGPDEKNLTEETFEMIVEVVRDIIDSVNPVRTFYTLETMPWIYPHTPDSYLRLVKAIDRPKLGVHLDPVNMVCSPEIYYSTGDLIKECCDKLGPYIKSCHAKDIKLSPNLTTHLDEVGPGQGGFDYHTMLRELDRLHPDTPIMMEHLTRDEEYTAAASYIRSVADDVGVSFV